ncbi:MAG: T9SS type A sorting domain-containing protein [Bernardetiaceae bacterium]|nr:T9SS type A sorting domain-containing protein [Bernardetiaceae bacterium]
MTTKIKFLICFLLFLACYQSVTLQAQFVFEYDPRLEVRKGGESLDLAWAGGFNSPQFSTIDLNNDGIDDLFIYDRATGKVSTFLREGNKWVYAPAYEAAFPNFIGWCLLRDYDCDGNKDLFAATNFGIQVWRNIIDENNGNLAFVQTYDKLETIGRSDTPTNLDVDLTDIPVIKDIDGDGDLDFLNYTPFFGLTVELNKNFAVERNGTCAEFDYQKTNLRWGNFEECFCDEYVFGNQACRTDELEHAGSAILLLDVNGDGKLDLITGDIECNNLALLINEGTNEEAIFSAADMNFPPERPVNIPTFPAAYYEDVTGDGVPDLLVAPNNFINEGNLTNFRASAWLYENQGREDLPDFKFVREDFLQHRMIDVGEAARPVFVDADNDGDLDLFIGTQGQPQSDGSFRASLFYFENTGNRTDPVFTLRSEDAFGLQQLNWRYIRPAFADLNEDGKKDLIITAYSIDTRQTSAYLFPNIAEDNSAFEFSTSNFQTLPISLRITDEVYFYDMNRNGKPDALIGSYQGALRHFENKGNLNFELKNDALGGINNDTRRRFLSLWIADLDGDGKDELITGTDNGKLLIYPDFMTQLEEQERLTPEEQIFFNPNNGRIDSYFFGRGAFPAVYEQSLVVGTLGGGLLHFSNTGRPNATAPIARTEPHLTCFPNPTSGILRLRSSENGNFQIYTTTGALLPQSYTMEANQNTTFDFTSLPKGLYLIRFKSNTGNSQTLKFVKE